MAEELNVDNEMSSMSIPDLSAFDTSSFTPSADIKNIDAYSNVVGNPITGSNPQSKLQAFDTSNIADNFENKIRQSVATYEDPYKKMRPYSYNGDYDGANFERYHSTDQYKTLGFSPYRDNESLYNNNMTLGDQFSRAASQWDNLIVTGFKSGIKSWGTLFTDPLAPDMESANEMKRAMAIGSSGAGGLGGFAINTFLNSGFTIGIMADFIAEELALSAVTAFSGGLAGEVTLPGMAAKAGMATRRLAGFGEVAAQTIKTIDKGAEIERLAKAGKQGNETLNTLKNGLNTIPEMQSFWNTAGGKFAKGTFDVLNPFENTIKALGKTDYASGLAKTAKTFGGFVDDVIQIKGTVSEAVLEGGMTKLDVTEKLIDQYRAANFGQDPQGEELTKIENLASQEAHRVALYNLPAISVSNKLMYATMVAPISKLIGRGTSNSLNSILFKKPLKGGTADAPFEVLGQGMRARATAAVKSLASPKTYGRYGMDYLKANFAEGIQENIQDAISSSAVEHALATYSDPSKASYEGYMGYFMNGLNDQFSAQGFETFAGGLAMGMFAQPVMGSVSWTVNELSQLTNKKEADAFKANKEAQDQRDVAALNALYKDDLKFFAPDLKNSIKQQGFAKDFYTAVQNGEEKEARDAQFNAIQSHLSTAIRTGKLDIFLDKLSQYKELDSKSALEAFQKYGITTEEDAVKAQGQIDNVIERAKKLRNKSENIGAEFPNPYNYQQYQAGTALHSATVKAYEAWEEAKQNLLYAESAFEDHADRVSKMAATFSSIANEIGKADAQTFMRLLDPNDTVVELATLQKEIESLGTLPEQASLKKEKQKTFDLLSYYHSLVKASQIAESPEQKKELDKEAKKAFKKYVNHVSKKNNTIVFDAQVNKAYQLIVDSHTLKNEMQGLAKSINVLSNPNGFLNTQERIYTAFQELDKEKIVSNNNKTFSKVVLNNKLHNAIFNKTGLKLSEDFMDAYKKAAETGEELPIPTSFVNPKTNEVITEGEDFDIALDIWNTFVEVVPKEESKVKKKEPVINKEGEEEYKSFSDNLKNDINALFEQAKKNGEIAEDETIGNFIKTNPNAILQIKVTQSQEKLEKEQAKKSKEPEEVASAKIETAPHPEAVEALNMMGYTNTQIKALTKDERAKILTDGIFPEDFYKVKPTEPTTTPTDIETKKANIEKTRQEKISKIVSKYFPNSKFTDILYHGTRGQERFEKFDENRMGELDSGYFGKGFYLTPERAYAEGYAKPYNGIVLYTVVNLENPLVTDANQANTGITLENNDGAIVKLGEDTLGISEEKYDPNQVIEVVLKKADQIQILSEEESRKVDEINAEYNAKLEALEQSTEVKKADVERKHTFTRDSLKEISDGTGLAKKGTEILNPDKVSSQLNVGDKITFYAEKERTGVWDGKAIREDKSNNPFGILGVLSSTDGYIKNQSAIDAELDALEGKPAETVKDNVSETKDAINNTPIQPSKASGNKVLYIPRKIVELAYANDKDNNPDLGGTGQELSNIIRRGGYAIEELNNLLPGWRTISLEAEPTTTIKKAPITTINDEYIGKIIYMTPGSGKEELAKNNVDVIDADDLILQTAQDLNPNFKPDPNIEKYKRIGLAYDAVGKQLLQDEVAKNMRELANKGKTIIMSSYGLMKHANIIMIQQKPELITKGYNILPEIEELDKLDKTTIAITDVASNVLQKPSAVLLGQAVTEIAENIEPQDITVEDINKNINEKNLNVAKEKGFDAIYKNERYAIVKVNKKTVSLKPIEGNPISVNIADITAVVSSEKVPISEEEIDIFNKNQSSVKKSDLTIDETPNDTKDTLNDIINNLCNKK